MSKGYYGVGEEMYYNLCTLKKETIFCFLFAFAVVAFSFMVNESVSLCPSSLVFAAADFISEHDKMNMNHSVVSCPCLVKRPISLSPPIVIF